MKAAPDKTWLSSFMLVFGVVSVIAAGIAFLFGGAGFFAGLGCLGLAAGFFALGRILDCLDETVRLLRRLEDRLKNSGDET